MSSEKDSLVEYCDPIRVKKNDQKLSGNYGNQILHGHLYGHFKTRPVKMVIFERFSEDFLSDRLNH